MAKVSLQTGTTSYLARVFIQDSSSTTGAGLTGLVFNSSGLVCYRARDDDGNAGGTAMTLVTATRGTWTSLGFVEKDATNLPGVYEFGVPNAALASGSKTVLIMFKGATNMAQTVLEIELTATSNQDAVRGGMTALPNANAEAAGGLYTRGSGAGQINQPANGQIDANTVKVSGTAQTARDIGASVLLSAGTGTGQLDFTSGVVKANLAQILGTALTETAGQIAAAFKQFFNIASPTSTMNLITGVTTATNLTNAPTAGDLTATMKASVTTAATAATPTAAAVTGSVGSVASGGINRASFAADTGLQSIRSNTAQAGAAGTLTLDASASATADFYVNCILYLTGGTGVGQARFITAYNGTTKVATVNSNWKTTPDATTTFAVMDFDAIPGATAPTAAQVATAVWQDLLAGSDFSTASSIGALLKTDIDATISSRSTLGGTAQTGDAYARLGAPAGASVSADVAAIKTDTGNLVTRITSTLFSGITSLAQWLGMLAGKQVGNTTARTEIRATGAGSGTFDETTDSAEAIKDNTGVAGAGLTALGDTRLANLDTTISSRLAAASITLTGGQVSIDATSKTGLRLGATGLSDVSATILTTALTESYAADGAAPTLSQAIFAIQQMMQERAISSTTMTVKKLDGTTTAMTFTLDSASSPTTITRAT